MGVTDNDRRRARQARMPARSRRLPRVTVTAAIALAIGGCAERAPGDWPEALLEARVPRAAAGDPSWIYAQRARADFDGDGAQETAVLICDVMLDASAVPLWEDGHRWQVYVEEPDGARTYLYARLVPNGALTAELTQGVDGRPTIVLLERTPDRVGVYELRYDGPENVTGIEQLERRVDRRATFQGSPRP